MNKKGQGALEYLLLIGGAVLVAVIVITLLLQITDQGEKDTTATANAAAITICKNRLQTICPGFTSGSIDDACSNNVTKSDCSDLTLS